MSGQQFVTDQLVERVADLLTERLADREPWLDKRGLADHLCCSTRSIENAMAEGMPNTVIFGRVKFRAHECERWLAEHGHLRPSSGGSRIDANANGAATADTAPPLDREVSPDGIEA